jgi:hypothetical protein
MATQSKAPMAPSFESDLRLEHTADIIARRVQSGKKLPLEVMLDVMDLYTEQGNNAAAAALADRAAPYVHPKLKDLVITGGGDGAAPIRIETTKGMSKMSAKELDMLEKLLQKASE